METCLLKSKYPVQGNQHQNFYENKIPINLKFLPQFFYHSFKTCLQFFYFYNATNLYLLTEIWPQNRLYLECSRTFVLKWVTWTIQVSKQIVNHFWVIYRIRSLLRCSVDQTLFTEELSMQSCLFLGNLLVNSSQTLLLKQIQSI